VPHQVTENDKYEGYFIPKGSIVHNTIFAMVRDETVFPDPEIFNPDRWLNPKYPTYQEPLTQYPNLKRSM
jgi:cytochrome P450